MTKWKWMLAARLPAKVFVINEFADFFWLDCGHWRNIAEFARVRLGLSGSAVAPASCACCYSRFHWPICCFSRP